MGGAWYRPHGATPTTHILKLPLGIVGNFRGDFSDSVENEWLCAQLMREFGLPIADADILTYGKQTVLSVKRFDRRWVGATAADVLRPQSRSYGRPMDRAITTGRLLPSDRPISHREIRRLTAVRRAKKFWRLSRAANPGIADRAHFVLAQLAFWLLAATDGHAKNFSIFHRRWRRVRHDTAV